MPFKHFIVTREYVLGQSTPPSNIFVYLAQNLSHQKSAAEFPNALYPYPMDGRRSPDNKPAEMQMISHIASLISAEGAARAVRTVHRVHQGMCVWLHP